MRGSLSVRVADGYTHRILTSKTRDLRFRKTAPGGHHSASCRLILPRDTFRDLGPADRLYIYDSRTARTIWEGYTENPGVTDGSGGQEFDLTAMGGMVLASDESRPLVYMDKKLDKWKRITSAGSSTTEASTIPGVGGEALKLQLVPGQPVTTGTRAQMEYDFRPYDFDMGAFQVTRVSGQIDTGYTELVYWAESGSSAAPWSRNQSTTSETINGSAANDGFFGARLVIIRLMRTGGATNVSTDNVWTAFSNPIVKGQHLTKYGARVAHVQADYTTANAVAADLLGRVLVDTCDPDTSSIDAATFQIDQLAYPDGATATQVLDDLALYEPDFLWEILESGSSGKHRFNYRAWPTTPRYEISVRDGYNAPGGEADLCNRIAVYWKDAQGRDQVTMVTQTVSALGSRTRDAEPIALPDGLGSSVNATRIGQQVLASKATPPKAATAVVKRPILDRLTGMTVMPWEIEPGYLVRVRETGDDLRLTEMEYVDQDCSATLTLGTPVRSVEQMIADLSRSRR